MWLALAEGPASVETRSRAAIAPRIHHERIVSKPMSGDGADSLCFLCVSECRLFIGNVNLDFSDPKVRRKEPHGERLNVCRGSVQTNGRDPKETAQEEEIG